MGKRKAAKIALLRAGDTEGLQVEVDVLKQTVENLQVLLNRETERANALEAQVISLKVKKVTKKTKVAKKTVTTDIVEG